MVRALVALVLSCSALPWAAPPTAAADHTLCRGLPATIVGTMGDDHLYGTNGADVIAARDGDDTVVGGLGDDLICGGDGDDLIQGHGDDDRIYGGAGDDAIDGGVGGCCAPAPNTGDDVIVGGFGDDVLHGSDFAIDGSTIDGRRGDDRLYIYAGGAAYGGRGDDEILQWSADALLDGGAGDDWLDNGNDPGNDDVTLLGGSGADRLTSDDTSGTSTMDGGSEVDSCTGGTTTVDCEG